MAAAATGPQGPSPSVGSEHDVVFSDLLASGQGVGRIGGMVVFVWGPLPGEEARVRITEVKKAYAVGAMLELLARSPERVEAFCPVFGTCGGCQLQHLAYPAQLEWKRRMVRDALERIGGFAGVEVAPVMGMDDPRAYRNKMSLVVDHRAGTRFGFYQMRSHDFVPIEGCPVVVPLLDAQIAALRQAARDPALAPGFAGVRHAVSRVGTASQESVVALSTKAPSPSPNVAAVAPALAERLPGVVGVAESFAPATENAILGRKFRQLAGRAEVEERIGDARYRVSPASFFQINTAIVARIFETLSKWLTGGALATVDLYCGAGTFTIFFALRGCSVAGVEVNSAALREARANARLNGVEERVRFLAGRVETVVTSDAGREALRGAEIVFLDPPRKGSD
ncbi:MAG: 23S rRNA (uracil(1939)-C(5))-methyltransferase RlmD, partial [Candidatus Eremiobacteraeota bacterium]|nr:23S rRNA (uracil(1939)-C(5))-methyltransferase RlmD [Candidatus Eremiobacteraeota bacterium]